jgi:hypothetical protein
MLCRDARAHQRFDEATDAAASDDSVKALVNPLVDRDGQFPLQFLPRQNGVVQR